MSSTKAPAAPKTLTKKEVIEALGKSKRTVETYISTGRLACEYFNGPNGKTARFKPEEVAELKRNIDNPIPQIKTPQRQREPRAPRAAAPAVPVLPPPDYWADVARMVAAIAPAPAPVKPWLDLKAAVDYSGLPASYLVRAAVDGSIRAVNVGTGAKTFWRFSREALAK